MSVVKRADRAHAPRLSANIAPNQQPTASAKKWWHAKYAGKANAHVPRQCAKTVHNRQPNACAHHQRQHVKHADKTNAPVLMQMHHVNDVVSHATRVDASHFFLSLSHLFFQRAVKRTPNFFPSPLLSIIHIERCRRHL